MAEMADKVVEVPGVGNVAFPGGMADDAVAEAIKGHLSQQSTTIAKMQAEHPEPKPYYGFTPGNIAKNVVGGAVGVAKGLGQVAGDLVSNPNWLTGKDSTFEKFVLNPAGEQAQKATDEWKAGHPVQAAGHELAGALPMVGPWAASLGEQAGRGDVGGAAGQAVGTMGAMKAPGILGDVTKPLRNAAAERVAGSLIGTVPQNTFKVSQPAPALVKEGIIAATPRGLLNKIGDRISNYNDTVKSALKASAPAAPESLRSLIQQATDPIIKLAREGLDPGTATRVESWRDNAIKQYPGNLPLNKLYEVKQKIGQAGGTYRGGQVEEPGLKDARQAVITAINQRVGERIPGLRDITQRESALITAGNLLENKARLAAGAPLIPGMRVFGGIGGGEGGLGLSGRAMLPFETLGKTAVIKALGTRAPLGAPVIPPPAPQQPSAPGGVNFGSPPAPSSTLQQALAGKISAEPLEEEGEVSKKKR